MSSRYKRKGFSKFIMIEAYLKKSAAWKALTPIERCAYLEVKWRYDGSNNGRIGLGCRELADELNMSRNTADRALAQLQEKGFIDKVKPSAFHVKNRAATEWRLTEYKCDVTGELPTKDFMRWGLEKKQQSHPGDTQSHPWDAKRPKSPLKTSDSPTHGTVEQNFEVPQSRPWDTYRSTIGGSANLVAGQANETVSLDAAAFADIPTDETLFTVWLRKNIPDRTKHREAFRLLRERKMTPEILKRFAA